MRLAQGTPRLNPISDQTKACFHRHIRWSDSQPGAPNGAFADGWFLNIHNVSNVRAGGLPLRSTIASFSTGVGDFRWCGDSGLSNPGWCPDSYGSNWSLSTRTAGHWVVVADSDVNNMPNLLLRSIRSETQIVGYCDMPFALTIDLQ